MLIDSHTHLNFDKQLGQILQANKIKAILNCQSSEELEFNRQFKLNGYRILSAGIHPWDAGKYEFNEFLRILDQVDVVGEIGLDSVWTNESLQKQKQIFEYQLIYASKKNKPVILHTKGCEKEILELIKKYPNRYYVHWYDYDKYIEEYLQLGCFFSIGPDVMKNLNVKKLVEKVPIDKMLIETDGLESLSWVAGTKISQQNYLNRLEIIYFQVAKLKQITFEDFKIKILNNFNKFIDI